MPEPNQLPSFYKSHVEYANAYELLKKFITLYSVGQNLEKGENYLRPRLVEVLTYYVLKGYSDETKTLVLDSIPDMKITNLNQINSELQKKGYLIKDTYQSHLRHVTKPLIDLKKYLDSSSNGVPLFLFVFNSI
jgi:hypothetical protein